MVANTRFKKRWGRTWTHKQQGRTCQIDYVCVDAALRGSIVDAGASKHFNMGSDHGAVRMRLRLGKMKPRRWKKKRSVVGWTPEDTNRYKDELTRKVEDFIMLTKLSGAAEALQMRCQELEQIVAGTAHECRKLEQLVQANRSQVDAETTNLIQRRRQLDPQEDGYTHKRQQLSKQIQNSIG